MSTDVEVIEGETLLRVVLNNQPRNWNNEGYRKLKRHLKKSKK